LDDICTFAQKESEMGFMKSLAKKDDRIAQIDAYYHQLDASVASFQVRHYHDAGTSRYHLTF
jgi:cytochrome c553